MIGALVLAAALAASPAASLAAETCTVDDATMTWGFKESFRSYISGTIANGEWTVSDGATYETPYFGFSGGTGTFTDGAGSVSFEGAIEFTGHGGILDTTVSNPRLRFDGEEAVLYLDISGTTQEGEPVDDEGVRFATVDLGSLVGSGNGFRLVDAEVTLTAEGAAAFGTYESGERLDPVSASIPTVAACNPMDKPGSLVPRILETVLPGIVLVLVASAVLVVVLLARRGRRLA